MTRAIFVNLPVADLNASMAFYAALGFKNNPQFTDDTAACMVWSEAINVMLLTHAKWRTFTSRPIPPATSSEVLLALSCESRAAVDDMNTAASANGGKADINPVQDHGFGAASITHEIMIPLENWGNYGAHNSLPGNRNPGWRPLALRDCRERVRRVDQQPAAVRDRGGELRGARRNPDLAPTRHRLPSSVRRKSGLEFNRYGNVGLRGRRCNEWNDDRSCNQQSRDRDAGEDQTFES